jgi:hypothetical protein
MHVFRAENGHSTIVGERKGMFLKSHFFRFTAQSGVLFDLSRGLSYFRADRPRHVLVAGGIYGRHSFKYPRF